MPRFSDNQVDKIKSSVAILEQAKAQGYTLKSQGSEYALCCPFHEDKTPSCFINPKKNVFCCHGCGEKGDVIQWLMKTDKVTPIK